MKIWFRIACAVAAFAIARPIVGRTQPSPPTGVDLSGTWTLDTYLSDSPEQVSASIRIDLGQGAGEQLFPGLEGERLGRGGMGRRGQGGSPRGRSPAGARPEDLSTEDQKKLDEMTAAVRFPPLTLTISQTSTSVTFTESPGKSRSVQPNGKREKQTLESGAADSTTKWEGPQLVSEYDLGKGRKMTYTYSIVPTTKQLLVRVTFERSPGQPGPFEVKHVYNRTPAPSS